MTRDFSRAAEPVRRDGLVQFFRLHLETSEPTQRPRLEIVFQPRSAAEKIVTLDELHEALQRWRQARGRIVMTNGCFDLLHPGHVASLQEARRLGDCLVVGLNSDRSVRELKGPNRPLIDQQGRATMLAALECVDYVVLFDEPTVAGLVAQVAPHVLVKSAEYAPDQVVGGDFVQQHGGRVALVPMQSGYSTSQLVARLRGQGEK